MPPVKIPGSSTMPPQNPRPLPGGNLCNIPITMLIPGPSLDANSATSLLKYSVTLKIPGPTLGGNSVNIPIYSSIPPQNPQNPTLDVNSATSLLQY